MGMTWIMIPSVWGPGYLLSYTNSSVLNHFSFWNSLRDKEGFCVCVRCRLKLLDRANGYIWIVTFLKDSRKEAEDFSSWKAGVESSHWKSSFSLFPALSRS